MRYDQVTTESELATLKQSLIRAHDFHLRNGETALFPGHTVLVCCVDEACVCTGDLVIEQRVGVTVRLSTCRQLNRSCQIPHPDHLCLLYIGWPLAMRLLSLSSILILLGSTLVDAADSELYPPGLLPLINRANILLSTGQFNEAAKVYSEAIGKTRIIQFVLSFLK